MDTSKIAQQYRFNQWTQRISDCRSSGNTVTDWCAENNIKISSYFYWLKKIRQAACEALPAINAENNQIVPLRVAHSTATSGSADQKISLPEIVIKIGTVNMEIHNNASQGLIENTLRALQNVR